MQEKLNMPCSPDCICVDIRRVGGELPKFKNIQAGLTLHPRDGSKPAEELFIVAVPVDSTYADWRAILRCRFADVVRERMGSGMGTVRFELDGSPLRDKTWQRRLQQSWHEFTWRGRPAWATTWVIAWPHAPMPPAPPSH